MKKLNPIKRILLGPGPSDVSPDVLQALSLPTLGHLDPQFITIMDDIKRLLQYAFQTKNRLTLPISAPGSAGMEACFVNLLEPGDKVVVCINGVFGKRMVENAVRIGAIPIIVDHEWGQPVDPQKVRQALSQNKGVKALAFVHAETSTGVLSDVKALCALACEFNVLSIVDTVTALGGSPLKVDEWHIDATYSGSQKCLSCVPGLSPVSFSDRAVEVISRRRTKVQSWFLDLNLVMEYWGQNKKRSYHHTAPVNSLYALYESLRLLKEEGLENSWRRHHENYLLLKSELTSLGLEFFVAEEFRLPQLNAIKIPEGVNEGLIRSRLLSEFNIEIGAGLGPLAGQVWRIGLMGASSKRENIELLIKALGQCL